MYNQEKCKFSKTHEWVFIEGDTAVCGISDHAQHEISDIVFVELPKVGAKVEAGKSCALLKTTRTALKTRRAIQTDKERGRPKTRL